MVWSLGGENDEYEGYMEVIRCSLYAGYLVVYTAAMELFRCFYMT